MYLDFFFVSFYFCSETKLAGNQRLWPVFLRSGQLNTSRGLFLQNWCETFAKTMRKSQGALDIQPPRLEYLFPIKYLLNFCFVSFYFCSETGLAGNHACDQVSFDLVNWAHMVIYLCETYATLMRKACENRMGFWIFNRRTLNILQNSKTLYFFFGSLHFRSETRMASKQHLWLGFLRSGQLNTYGDLPM